MNYFLEQAQNNRWSNRRLLSACLALSCEEYIASRTGFFPSIQLTLRHILEVDKFYLGALASDVEAQREELPGGMSRVESARLQTTLDDQLIGFCENLDEYTLSLRACVVRPQGMVMERVDRLLLHLFQHQIHHRGQVHTMLSGTSVPPPQLDEFYLDADAPLRAKDGSRLIFPSDGVGG